MSNSFVINPKVDTTQEFIEIANDFSNPLDLVREAISNAYDAKATFLSLTFDVIEEYGEKVLQIVINDNGGGMDKKGLQSFFDLGNSLSRDKSENIGEKGHGTKIYFNSSSIEVTTSNGVRSYKAIMDKPIQTLYNRKVPQAAVLEFEGNYYDKGTCITIKGYNHNRRERFTHEELKDYIMWFTKFGSFENEFSEENVRLELKLKGLNVSNPEIINFGHLFPDESECVNKLFDNYLTSAPDYYCKRVKRKGQLKKHPEISYTAIFSIEGNKVKQQNNPMLRRSGKPRVSGDYTVQERYGIWLCKDFIPIQRKNEWITYKGNEHIKFHAFFNCQGLRLTANRGSVDNTQAEILEDIKTSVKEIYEDITNSDDWIQMEWLEEEVQAHKTSEKERKEFAWRKKKILNSNIAVYNNAVLIEPQRESGVFALTMQLLFIDPTMFPFVILDYDTHSGIDVIVKGSKDMPITSSELFYVEFKHTLTRNFNHSFCNLHSIICWDTDIKHDGVVSDLGSEQRTLEIIPPYDESDYTRYYLTNRRSAHRIEVYVLKDYIKQKLKVDFRPRTEKDIF